MFRSTEMRAVLVYRILEGSRDRVRLVARTDLPLSHSISNCRSSKKRFCISLFKYTYTQWANLPKISEMRTIALLRSKAGGPGLRSNCSNWTKSSISLMELRELWIYVRH